MGGNSITLYVFQPRNNVEKERGEGAVRWSMWRQWSGVAKSKEGARRPSQKSPLFKAFLQQICDFRRNHEGKGIWKLKNEFR